jgi:C1A family cysteine protease
MFENLPIAVEVEVSTVFFIPKTINRIYNLQIEKLPKEQLNIMALPKNKKGVALFLVDLRSKMPPIYNQESLGSCTANGLCAAIEYDDPSFMGSRLFLYYNERKLENDIPEDAGAQISDGVKCLLNYGICSEYEWPYNISKFADKPPSICYKNALKHKALQVQHIQDDEIHLKECLANGFPIVLGIKIFKSFESENVAQSGNVPMPKPNEECLGGHCVVLCGYNDNKQVWIMRNSWGVEWGDDGYFYLPYAYLLDSNLATDFWAIQKVSTYTEKVMKYFRLC